MAEYEVIKTTLFGGYKKSAVHEVIQRLKDEMADQEASFRKEIEERNARIDELQRRIEEKDKEQARAEEEIQEKYQKYVDNYESISKLVLEAQLKAESMEKDAGEKCDKMVADAEEEAKRKINAIQPEIDERLAEGEKKYHAVQDEMNRMVAMIDQIQQKFSASYDAVHQIVSGMPEFLDGLDEMTGEDKKTGSEEEDDLDFLDGIDDMGSLDEEDEEQDDSKLALQMSKLLSEEDEAMLEEELEDL